MSARSWYQATGKSLCHSSGVTCGKDFELEFEFEVSEKKTTYYPTLNLFQENVTTVCIFFKRLGTKACCDNDNNNIIVIINNNNNNNQIFFVALFHTILSLPLFSVTI